MDNFVIRKYDSISKYTLFQVCKMNINEIFFKILQYLLIK